MNILLFINYIYFVICYFENLHHFISIMNVVERFICVHCDGILTSTEYNCIECISKKTLTNVCIYCNELIASSCTQYCPDCLDKRMSVCVNCDKTVKWGNYLCTNCATILT